MTKTVPATAHIPPRRLSSRDTKWARPRIRVIKKKLARLEIASTAPPRNTLPMFDDWVVVCLVSCFSMSIKTPFLHTASHFAAGEAPGGQASGWVLAQPRTRWHLRALGGLCCYPWRRIVWVVNMPTDERENVLRTRDPSEPGIEDQFRDACRGLDFDLQDVRLRRKQHAEL